MAAPALELAQPLILRLDFAPEAASVREAAATIRGFLAGYGAEEAELFACELCAAEAGNNAAEYAPSAARGQKLAAEVLLTPTLIELRVTDHTSGFVLPERIPTPPPLTERGRGLFLIQSLMDEVRYLRGATENILIMRKRRPANRPEAAAANQSGATCRSLEECRTQLAEAQNSIARMVRQRAVARELEIAQEIQHLLLPRTLPQLAGFGLAGGWQSAREVGGDFYDAIARDGDSLLLLIADVMGKGVPAALFATTMRGLLRGLAQHTTDVGQFLGSLNRLLFPELSSVNMFITAQVVQVDLRTRRVTVASAGHCPLLFVPADGGAISELHSNGLPIGVLPDTVYRPATAVLGSPAALLLHTDGLTDVRNPAGRTFGQRRLRSWMSAHFVPGRPATEVRDRLTKELNRFRGDAPMTDDQAFLLLTEEGEDAPPFAVSRASRVQLERGSFLFSSPS
jgi:serine phosphatase RsbU (regulator of sigma subunit)/anti-sigma regulatory factor (Ser/Thr protein kinase)